MRNGRASLDRSLFRQIFLAALFCIFLTPQTRGADASTEKPCPGAEAWNRSHPLVATTPNTNRSVSTAPSDVALVAELESRVERDQLARRQWLAAPSDENLASAVDAIDSANLAWLRKVVSEKGFPTAAMVGNEGVHRAWVLLQHADQDPQLQRELLPVLEKRYASGELPANDLARMTDRVLMASGKPQRFGTQFDWFADEFTMPEAADLARIDEERSRMGLMPLGDYVCTLRRARDKAK